MDDAKLRELLAQDLETDAEQILAKVNADPTLKDVKVPDELHDDLMKQIREYEEQKARENLSEEDKELIQFGKLYKKNKKRNRVLVALVAILIIATLGITSMGGPVKVIETVKRIVSGREQRNIQVGEDEIDKLEISNEEDAYQAIEDAFERMPVKLNLLPKGVKFSEIIIEKGTQNARIFYEHREGKTISYSIWFNYREGSLAVDIEDKVSAEYEKEVMGRTVTVKEYELPEGKTRWNIEFYEGKTYGSIMLYGLTETEVNSVAENLYFPN